MNEEWPGQRLHQYAIFDRDDCMIDILQGDERLNINAPDRCGRTPVYTAVSNNSIKCLEILLQHGADPSIAGGERVSFMTPLHQALLEGKEDAIKLLLRYGADLNKKDSSGHSPINLAHRISVERYIKLFDQEKERRHKNALLVVKDLCTAVEEGDLAKVKDILRLPAPSGWELANMAVPDSEDKKTPLVVAASKGDIEIMTELLNTVVIPKQSPSLIHIAIEDDNIEIVKILLERFPECCISEDDRNYTPLHKSCQVGSLSMVQCLMEWNYPQSLYRSLYNMEENIYYQMVIHVNAKTTDGKTPLYLACEGGHEGIVEYLLNFTVKGRKGDHDKDSVYSSQSSVSDSRKSEMEMSFKPVEIGVGENETQKSSLNFTYNDSVVQYRPTKVHQKENYILSSVYIAVKNQHHQVVDLLVNAGADLTCTMTKNGKEYATLLLLAFENSDILMLDKLMFHKVQDVNNSVLEEAVKSKPDFIPHFLKYKSSGDTHYSINRGQMKKEYPPVSVHAASFKEPSSENSEYFPVQPVTLRWQNIKVLNTVESSWLTCAANFNNPHMNNVNIRVPLFAITKVDVSNNSLTIMPASLLQLPSLCVLSVANNKITDFPSKQNFRLDCQCLEDIDIHCNDVETIPCYIFLLPKLRSLNATKNNIKELPPHLWQAYSLKSLDMTNNKLEKLPDPVWSDSTVELDVEQQPMSLEDSLNQSTQDMNQSGQELLVHSALKRSNHWSQSLVISDQNITTKKNDQKGLKVLKLSQNMISEFPEFLSCCAPFLETLDLSKNRLKCLGNLACYPMYLRTLDLSKNQINNMNDWRKAEDGGKCLSTAIIRETSGMDKTTNRPMSAVSFSGSCGHRMHTKLANLETLDLSSNAITSLCLLRSEGKKVSDITSSMTSLQGKEQMEQALQGRLLFPNVVGLYIDCNKIAELPGEIGELKVLRILSMKKNMLLRQLPPTLGLLDKLHRIEVELCPIEGPIQDVIKGAANKAADITGFLRSVLEESEEYNCMNLMLVGSHNIGKTTLLENLSKKGYLPYRRTHFIQRQGDRNGSGTTQDGRPLSTVGIDISRLVLDGKQGKVEFRTWDFAGQKEYYATHQYFLSPRSLYLAVWNLKDGIPGVEGLRQWLVNIQAQAPGAPVIIVGTHLDDIKAAKKGYTKDWDESMIEIIREKYMKVDSSYVGLPRVLDAINVGCYRKVMKVDKLKELIYDKVFNLTHPERKSEKLLGHKVPKKYMELQKCLESIVKQRLDKGREPVLDSSSYLLFVMEEMNKENCNSPFRNKEDLYQATRFLHENGVLCHFADTSLKDQYFLEPQWLCDQLAKVVSVQEVQKYSNEGVMKVKDLYRVYKNSDKIGQYILGLLNKFEVAIQFDQDHLLLPSLLPTDQKLEAGRMKEIPLKRRGSDVTNHYPEQIHTFGNTNFFQSTPSLPHGEMFIVCTNAEKNPAMSNTRLYLLTYFPSGFWPRLITRILADDTFYDPMMKMYPFPQEIVDKCSEVQKSKPCWRCWQTGIELVYFGNVIFQVKVVRSNSDYAQGTCNYDNEGVELQCFFDDAWSPLEMRDSSVLEISFQADRITFNFGFQESVEHQHFQSVESRSIYHDERAKASILAKFVEHTDGLLQDWYPEIGESRFMQSCTGRFLVTRVILCPLCLQEENSLQNNSPESWVVFNKNSDQSGALSVINPSTNTDNDSDVTAEPQTRVIYTFLVERCIKNALEGMDEVCLKHRAVSSTFMPTEDGTTRTLYLAPDLVFQDLESSIIVPDDALEIGKKLGRGAFGIVSSGKLRRGEISYDVAVKVMFDPNDKKKVSNAQMSLETMCVAYTMARQECFILQSIEHPNIVPLLGLSRRPLALLLALAPLGALNTSLDRLHNDGLKLQSWVIKQVVVQIADALDYLHGRNIIYRDLKSDNVLVWHLPSPEERDLQKAVLVKLADYGISRSVAHAGAKGFGGTPPFIAPEILLHAGKDIYTEKVDIFSFGMFMFELLTCRQPLKEISNPTLHVSHGGRPSITSEEADYPSHMLDLMTICWAQEPCDRPSAAQVRMIASSPQFCHLSDAVTLDTKSTVLSACTVYVEEWVPGGQTIAEQEQTQCWIISQQGWNFNVEILYYNLQNKYVGYKELIQEHKMLAICRVDTSVWCLDKSGKIHSFSCKTLEKELEYQLPVNMVTIVRSMVCYHGKKNSVGEKDNNIFILLKEVGEKQTLLFCLLEKDIKEENGNLTAVKLSRESFCFAAINTSESLKLWLGTTGGEILVRSMDNLESVEDDHFLHPQPSFAPTSQNCMFICTSQSNASNHSVWSYNYPGSKVYRWDADKEVVLSVLDCANIMPMTDCMTLRPQRHDASQHQVTAISVIEKYLYVATTGGCVIVADCITLQAFSAFRCHSNEEYYCKAILPLGPCGNSVEDLDVGQEFEGQQGENSAYHQPVKNLKPGLVTIGRGYSDLVSNVTSLEQQAIVDHEVDEDWSLIETRSVRSTGTSNPLQKTCKADTHVLSWCAEHWEYY